MNQTKMSAKMTSKPFLFWTILIRSISFYKRQKEQLPFIYRYRAAVLPASLR